MGANPSSFSPLHSQRRAKGRRKKKREKMIKQQQKTCALLLDGQPYNVTGADVKVDMTDCGALDSIFESV